MGRAIALRMGKQAILGLGVAILSGCGGDGGGAQALDCAWASSDQNCWLALVDHVATCAVPAEATGVFDATRTRCTYAEGWVVDFDEPVPTAASGTYPWRFTVSHDGTPCVRYASAATEPGTVDLDVESGGQLVQATGSLADSRYTLTCPDGASYTTTDPYSVLTCSGGPRDYLLPVLTYGTSGSQISLSIPLGEEPGGADIEVPLFRCENPAP